jgi:hypothetical protein
MVYQAFKLIRSTSLLLAVGLFVTMAAPAEGLAQYTQLQVLLPGETANPGSGTGKLGTPSPQTVGIPFTITVRATDSQWNTVTSITNIVSMTSTDASASLPSNTGLVNGTIDLSVTLNAAGSFTFSATDESDPTIPVATSANVTSLLLQGFEFARINQKNQYAGIPMSIDVWAVDPNGDMVAGFSGPVRLQEITSFGVGRITPNIVNFSNGQWSGQVTLYRADETSINRGNVNIYALLDANPAINGTSDPFTVHPGPFSRVQIVVPGQSPEPGSVSGVTGSPATQAVGTNFVVDVFATDDYWNPLPSGDVVRVTSSDPGASTPVSGSMSNGWRQFTLSLGTVGSQTLTVSDQTNGSIQGMPSAPIPVIPSAPDHFEFDPISSPVTAGQSVSVTIRGRATWCFVVPAARCRSPVSIFPRRQRSERVPISSSSPDLLSVCKCSYPARRRQAAPRRAKRAHRMIKTRVHPSILRFGRSTHTGTVSRVSATCWISLRVICLPMCRWIPIS